MNSAQLLEPNTEVNFVSFTISFLSGSGQSVSIDRSTGGGTSDHPTRVYLPASRTNIYGLPVADIWSVEIVNWDGQIDWIDTEYEVLSN